MKKNNNQKIYQTIASICYIVFIIADILLVLNILKSILFNESFNWKAVIYFTITLIICVITILIFIKKEEKNNSK